MPLLIAAGFILLAVFAFYWRRREAVQGKSQLWELDAILAQLPEEERNALAIVAEEIGFDAMQLTLLGILVVILLALVVSVFLPYWRSREDPFCSPMERRA